MPPQPHDNVMGIEDGASIGLQPDYHLQWHEVFDRVARHVTLIPLKGIDMTYDYQQINITYSEAGPILDYPREQWSLQASAEPVQQRDIVCYLHGSLHPLIVRLCNDHFTVIVSTVILQPSSRDLKGLDMIPAQDAPSTPGWVDEIYMTREMSVADGKTNGRERYQQELISVMPNHHEGALQTTNRLRDMVLIIDAYRGERLPVSEDVVKAATANERNAWTWGIAAVCEALSKCLPMSEDVVKAPALNSGRAIMRELFEYYGDEFFDSTQLSPDAVAYEGYAGHRMIERLFRHYEAKVSQSRKYVIG
ncbi:hypothetical protein BO71DRAFT_432256 [Aspergillus ellipticus CBS 707.79]|uniref:Uncharacterized protein n=1 Tax=Aspergillus ellipticus CBS 707.79 TaxID=1448320 RepID=A0A319DLE9_9EURO|nr:hypothetical protein BO71DRAFT_432256 [Aspergillus ellipticus CBS 707.79]